MPKYFEQLTDKDLRKAFFLVIEEHWVGCQISRYERDRLRHRLRVELEKISSLVERL